MYTAISLKNPEKLKPKITETDQSATKDVPGISKDEKSSELSGSAVCNKDEQNILG